MMEALVRMFVVISLLLVPLKSFSAETARLRYLLSVYLDDKGVGMKHPQGVACNSKSLLIVGDTGNDRLLRYTYQDKGVSGGGEIRVPQLSSPIGVQMSSKGEIFALDGKQRRIIRLSPEGDFKGYLTPEGVPDPSSFVPRSFKIDSNDNIYILDVFSGRVLILAPDGKFQKQIDFPKEYGFFSDLAVDFKGTILLIDCIKLMVFSAPKDSNLFSPLSGSLKEYLNFPTAITTDRKGAIYIVDQNGSGIVILGPDASFLGRQLSMGWTEGLLYYPTQICTNDKGEAFIADRGNSRVQIFHLIQ